MTFNTSKLETPVVFPRENGEWHHYLQGRVNQALAAKRCIENLPEQALMFDPSEIDGLKTHSRYKGDILKLCGAWKTPETVSNSGAKWINPNHPDAYRYSDSIVRCACGVPMLHSSLGHIDTQPANSETHGDCCQLDRLEARTELAKRKRDIVIDLYEHGQSLEAGAKRLGYESGDQCSGDFPKRLGLDIWNLNRESRKRIAKTVLVLARQHSTSTIGEIYGVNTRAISEMLNRETKSSAQALLGVRKAL